MLALKSVLVTTPLKESFLAPDVSRNNSNCASPASSAVKQSSTNVYVWFPEEAVYKSSTLPVAEINPPT